MRSKKKKEANQIEKRRAKAGRRASGRAGRAGFICFWLLLQDQTLLPSLAVLLGEQRGASGVLEYLANALVGLG